MRFSRHPVRPSPREIEKDSRPFRGSQAFEQAGFDSGRVDSQCRRIAGSGGVVWGVKRRSADRFTGRLITRRIRSLLRRCRLLEQRVTRTRRDAGVFPLPGRAPQRGHRSPTSRVLRLLGVKREPFTESEGKASHCACDSFRIVPEPLTTSISVPLHVDWAFAWQCQAFACRAGPM